MRHLYTAIAFLVLQVFLCAPAVAGLKSVSEEIAAATLVQVGQEAPDFACKRIDGRPFILSELRGKVVLLYFFASSAPFSVTEMKYIESNVFQKLREREDFVMLAVGRGYERDEVVKIGGKNGLEFPMVHDPKSEIYGKYFSKFVPRTVVLDRDGKISFMANGFHEYDGIVDLQTVLAKELGAQGR